jgi:pyrroline-5-carboxylate reductase
MINIGIAGYGNMGRAIGERIREKYNLCVFDKNKAKIPEGVNSADSPEDLAGRCEALILAVKPQDFDALLEQFKGASAGKLIVSIAAGITTRYIRSRLGEDTRIIRVMPNLPAQVGQGATVLFRDRNATEADLGLAWDILSSVGLALPVPEEKMMDAATAVSGSGPGFFCYFLKDISQADQKRGEFIEMLTEAAMSVNFDRQFAKTLSEKTVDGTIAILKERNLTCPEMIKMVASKGGTTQAGLDVLSAGGSLKDAVEAALKRAAELGKGS